MLSSPAVRTRPAVESGTARSVVVSYRMPASYKIGWRGSLRRPSEFRSECRSGAGDAERPLGFGAACHHSGSVIVGVCNMCADEVTRAAFVATANGVDDAVMLAQVVRSTQRGHRQEVEPDALAEVTQILGEDRVCEHVARQT